MKAIQLRGYGGVDQLHVVDAEPPLPAEEEVLVEVHAAGVTLTDVYIRLGYFDGVWGLKPPLIPGWDYAGIVQKVGAAVQRFRPGDRVFGMRNAQGAQAQFLTAGPENISHIPEHWPLLEAAAFPLAATTAFKAIVEAGRLTATEHILIFGASGGVGSFGVLLAKSLGATVTGVASAAKQSYLEQFGALPLASTADEMVWRTQAADLILDAVGPAMDPFIEKALAPGGRVIRIAGPPDSVAALNQRGIAASFVGTEPNAARLAKVAALADAHAWKIPVDRAYPLAGIRLAHEALEGRKVQGKVVLQVRD